MIFLESMLDSIRFLASQYRRRLTQQCLGATDDDPMATSDDAVLNVLSEQQKEVEQVRARLVTLRAKVAGTIELVRQCSVSSQLVLIIGGIDFTRSQQRSQSQAACRGIADGECCDADSDSERDSRRYCRQVPYHYHANLLANYNRCRTVTQGPFLAFRTDAA